SFTECEALIAKALENIETISVNVAETAQVKDEFADLF
ncbi:hypothetical protein, partial [Listeria monocytogenes]